MSVIDKFGPPDILVVAKFTATNTDPLSGTDLDTPPGPGIILLYLASTVNTATIEVNQGNHKVGVTNIIPLWANGIPQIKDMIPWVLPVGQSDRPKPVIGGTTGTIHLIACYYAKR